MRVKADQNPSFQILLKPGEKFERKAVNFDMYIGNAGGIKIQFKGKDIEDMGKTGDVIHLRLPLILKNKIKRGNIMFGINIKELLIILVIVLIIFCAGKLPEIGSKLWVKGLKT